MNHSRRFASLAAPAFLTTGCTYGYAAPYSRCGTGPEITLSATPSQSVRYMWAVLGHVPPRLVALLVVLVAALGFGPAPSGSVSTAQAQVLADGMGTTVESLKDDLIARLAECETQGKADRDTLITRDANGEVSMGRLQLQTRTVIAYTKETEDRNIDSMEARRIALDSQRSATLAKKIIFEKDGVRHWHHCARKLGLYQEVNAIQKMR